jgi:hypothetical protein
MGMASLPMALAQAHKAQLDVYPVQRVYSRSAKFSLIVNGQNVAITSLRKYDIAQFALGAGETTISIIRGDHSTIEVARISPRRLGIRAEIEGPKVVFHIRSPQYLIARIDALPELVLAIDPLQKGKPNETGRGVFNVAAQPFGAIEGPDYSTTNFQRALDAASDWGTRAGSGRQGLVFVPSGLWTVGSLYLSSNTNLYLAPGAVLRFTGAISHYRVDGHKDSQNRDLTWFVSTRPHTRNISITGRGTIDGNGLDSLKAANLGVNLLVPVLTEGFLVDGITFRESSSWGVIPTRSRDVTLRNIKIFNGLDMGENDGLDVVESSNVLVHNAIAISLDDPFSTKTWQPDTDMFRKAPGDPQPIKHVRIDHVIAWTRCYGFKIGQGVEQPQDDVAFTDGVVYDAAVGFGIHHKWGAAPVTNVSFKDIDIEHLCCKNDGNRTWMALWVANQPGPDPINGVTVSNIVVWDAGTTPARINGLPGSPITHVRLENVRMPDSESPATTLPEMHITGDTFHGPVEIKP